MKFNITILYYCFVLTLLYVAWIVFKSMRKKKNYNYAFRQPKMKFTKSNYSKEEINTAFTDAGINITTDKYNNLRLIIFLTTVILTCISYHGNRLPIVLALWLTAYLISAPVIKLGKKDSPFMLVIKMIKTMQNKKKDTEIYRILIQLKNIAITQQDKPYSADYTINQLIKFSKLTRNALINFLMYYNIGKEDEAYKKFTKDINTQMGNDIGMILLKLDKLNPTELIEQIDIIKERNREKHITEKHRKQNAISDLIYLPIIIPVFILFLNFIMITVWIPRIEKVIFIN
ncbi:hypothetical protein [Vallitalea guaymasensis]|uniref:hypothetical protein n=1 Tax=Vallitalea guaymasensis TaxID=1185412 RepID=UPI00272C8EB6|nr:hypothetical protein [Vallitalea guaymasensis]